MYLDSADLDRTPTKAQKKFKPQIGWPMNVSFIVLSVERMKTVRIDLFHSTVVMSIVFLLNTLPYIYVDIG